MQSGTVKFYNEAKGFGFIITDGSLEEVFVHMSGVIDAIREGDKVTFNTTAGKKGTNAVDVKLAD
ncbi:MAG: cold shock domain-containing protein [Chitinophagaceae bacterium]|jgi:CspA family cold shock protein|nr:cold shock domain-containing protein [Chitinophagaceae bacterium]